MINHHLKKKDSFTLYSKIYSDASFFQVKDLKDVLFVST